MKSTIVRPLLHVLTLALAVCALVLVTPSFLSLVLPSSYVLASSNQVFVARDYDAASTYQCSRARGRLERNGSST